MLNEVPNDNEVKHVANIVLNKVPNSNDATRIGNNVCLTAVNVCTTILSGGYIAIMQKSRLIRDES